ncbi:unnamed protein product [Callosobruchus maculatus]|uniref:Uncharacterized protein n=1 Tax=Callosobruchus maculatus TaxID=64391 RepID=A0A653D1A4_CALMS|nr:unnamed protein product [Callosobruchus maculatus]
MLFLRFPGLSNVTDPSYVDGRIVQIAVSKEVTLTRYVIRHQTQNQVNSENGATRTEMPSNTLSFPQSRKTTAKASYSSTITSVV